MKRNIISAVIGGALILTSCVGSFQTNTDSADIEFRPVIGTDTRAEGSILYPHERDFRLWAVEDGSGEEYISDALISYNGGWYAPKPWTDGALRFAACWPTDLDCTCTTDGELQIDSFDSSEGQTGILLASIKADNKAGSLVTLNFQHILSRVEFGIMHSLQESMSMKINKVTLEGVAMAGSYKGGKWTAHADYGSYLLFEDAEGLEIDSGEMIELGKDFFAIPQMSRATLRVECQIHYGQAGSWIPQTYEISPMEIVWDAGKYITYTLNIRMDKMVHTITSTNNI